MKRALVLAGLVVAVLALWRVGDAGPAPASARGDGAAVDRRDQRDDASGSASSAADPLGQDGEGPVRRVGELGQFESRERGEPAAPSVAGSSERVADEGELELFVVDSEHGRPVTGVGVELLSNDSLEALFMGAVAPSGRAVCSALPFGRYTLRLTSDRYLSLEREVEIDATRVTLPPLALEPYPTAEVQLIGLDGADPARYEVARLMHALRVPFDDRGVAALPWPQGSAPNVTVHAPERIEVSALYFGGEASADTFSVRIGGGEPLAVHVTGAVDDPRPLVLALQFESALGYAAFVTIPTSIGATETFELCEPGALWADIGLKCDDGSLDVIGRARVDIVAGRANTATVDVGRARTWARFEASAGQPVRSGELYLAVEGETAVSPTGGPLDAEGRLVIPRQAERLFNLVGTTSIDGREVLAADVSVTFDTQVGGDFLVPLGDVRETEVELHDASTGEPLLGWRFDVVGGVTGQLAGHAVTGHDGAPGRVRWHAHGVPRFEIAWRGIWSPRTPVPLEPGRQRIPVTLRADCTITTPGAKLADLQHVATGLSHTALAASEGVTVEELANGRRYRGIPAGNYLARLEGEADWRGPFVVVSGATDETRIALD